MLVKLPEFLKLLETAPQGMNDVFERIYAEAKKPFVVEFRLSHNQLPAEHFANIYETRLKRIKQSAGPTKKIYGGVESIRSLRRAQKIGKKVLVGGFKTEGVYVVVFLDGTRERVIGGIVFEQ